MKSIKIWFLVLLLLSFQYLNAQLILSELMYDADVNEFHNEFVEIYNNSEDVIKLNLWRIGDNLELDPIVDAGYGMELNPGQFGVILDASYFENSNIYDDLIPQDALIVTINDGSFGRYGWSNSEPEPVILVSSSGDTVQSYTYKLNNSPGYSDEKIFLNSDNSSANWQNSKTFRGTPGQRNSVTPLQWDVSLDSLWSTPEYPIEESPFQVLGLVTNYGTELITQFSITVFDDLDEDLEFDSSEILQEKLIDTNLSFGDTTEFELQITNLNAGNHSIGVYLNLTEDKQTENNLKFVNVLVEPLEIPLIINEIMFRPLGDYPEWVELLNRGNDPIDIKNMNFSDATDTVQITDKTIEISSGNFLIIAEDSTILNQYDIDPNILIVVKSLPALNNDQDNLRILSFSLRPLDFVPYSKEWMRRDTEAGVSLERINPNLSSQISDNWAASVDASGGTPGRQNSIYIEEPVEESTISIHPNPFSPDSDGFEDFTLIQYNLPVQTAFITVDIFDVLGRKIRRLADQKPVGSSGSIIWDGRDQNGRIGRIGMYIVLMRMFERDRNLFKELKSTLVLTKK